MDRNIEKNKVNTLRTVKKHIWGNYRQLLINETVLMRSIRIYENGMNSLHKHNLDEVLIVESGSINCHIKLSKDDIVKHQMVAGDSILIKRNSPHRIEFVLGDFKEKGICFAQINELCLGKNESGNYKIHRLVKARNARKP